jgi:predicted dehydrogenase
VRLGIIGCGNVSLRFHLPACLEEPRVTLEAAADTTPARLELFREAAGLGPRDCSTDYRAILDRADVDAVLVATPQAYRPPIVLAALSAGKHVLSEKPLALAPADAWAMVRAAREAQLCLAVVHNYHFLPEYAAVKRVLESGIIGRPYVVTLNFLSVEDRHGAGEYRPTWRHDARSSGGGVLMDMLHAVYLAAWLMGEQPRAVSAAVDRRLDSGETVEDAALCRFEFESGFALVNMAWGMGPGGIEIMGTEGRLLLFYRGFGTGPFAPPEQLHVFKGDRPVTVELDLKPSLGMREVLRDFVASVAEGRDPIAPGEQGCAALEAVVGAYESAFFERQVTLPLEPSDPVYQHGLAGLSALKPPPGSRVARRGLFTSPVRRDGAEAEKEVQAAWTGGHS